MDGSDEISEGKTSRWTRAILALLTEKNLTEAAAKSEVPYSTLRRWMKNRRFLARYRRARLQLVEAGFAQLQVTTGEAVESLRRNLTCGIPAVEVRAAVSIMDLSVRGVELFDIENRMAAMFDEIGELKAANGATENTDPEVRSEHPAFLDEQLVRQAHDRQKARRGWGD
jgi:hypothetical protein